MINTDANHLFQHFSIENALPLKWCQPSNICVKATGPEGINATISSFIREIKTFIQKETPPSLIRNFFETFNLVVEEQQGRRESYMIKRT